MLKSHPNKRLEDHLKNVFLIGDKLLKSKALCFEIFDMDKIYLLNKICLLIHDAGKAMSYFQYYMEDIEQGESIEKHGEMKEHGLISGIIAYYITLKYMEDEIMAFLALMIVSRHHNSLENPKNAYSMFSKSNIGSNKMKNLEKQYNSINRNELDAIYKKLGLNLDISNIEWDTIINKIVPISKYNFPKRLDNIKSLEGFLLIELLFSILIYSDKLEAIFNSSDENIDTFIADMDKNKHIDSNIVDTYKKSFIKTDGKMAIMREEAYLDVAQSIIKADLEKKIYSINLPTGSGKTLTALKASLLLRERLKDEKGFTPKIIYILPFTSIIEQNFDVFRKVLGNDGEDAIIKHHYLADKEYKKSSDDYYDYDIAQHLIESWESEIVVSTFVQLLHSIFTNRNRQLKKVHNISNSIIILDEVQSIPYKYWNLINETFKSMARHYNCYFILMTATLPLIFNEEKGEIIELARKKAKYFANFNRIKINCDMLKEPINIQKLKSIVYNDIIANPDKSFLIVLNTVNSSIQLYEDIKLKLGKERKPIYLSSNIIPKDRIDRIKEIKEQKGNKIVISTQVVEAGVDIDMDIVYRDFGPMDSINQTSGRCNREGGKVKGLVKLFILYDEKNRDKEYCSYVYDSLLIESSKKVIGNIGEIEEKNLMGLSHKYFAELQKYGDDQQGREILNMIKELLYKDAFECSQESEKNKKVFRLIEEKFKTVDIFVELDEKAAKLWKQYEELKNIKNMFERRKQFGLIKRDFLQYVISVPENIAKKQFSTDDNFIIHISKYMVNNTYNIDTGFIRGDFDDYIH